MGNKYFDIAIRHTLAAEGGYSNNPNDTGGETMWGITIAVARANGYSGSMRLMPLSVAQAIYKKMYWDKNYLDEISAISSDLAIKLFDIGVNMGTARAGLFLQQTLNAFNRQGKLYPDILEDGSIGNVTVKTLGLYIEKRGKLAEQTMLRAINGMQCAFYIELAQKRQANEEFVFGWISNRII